MPDEMPSPSPAPGAASGPLPSAPTARPSTGRRLLVRWLKRLTLAVIIVLVLSGMLIGLAEHETSKPEFCGACHLMKPYYSSWHADLHGGKLEVACVECHYSPGERATVGAKMRGLSQLASYVSGRYGTSRPRAHVDNRSCLTSKCHGDLAFMDKEISLGTVKFFHAKHLRLDEGKEEARARELKELTQAFTERLGKERLAKLEALARECVPMKERHDGMMKLIDEWGVKVDPDQLDQLSRLQHRELRLAQLIDLQCTNCHSYVAPGRNRNASGHARHFTVKTTSCYTCHFTNEDFNTGTARCLMCHTLPTKDIIVHPEVDAEEKAKLKSPDLGKATIRMDHQAILKRKVDCIACHADVATENSTVSRRDCERCHDRPEYFEQWKDPLTLDLVKNYHALHVPQQRAKCLDCHSEIHHQLAHGKTKNGQPNFLSTVMSDCHNCHPNQHAAQVQLLSGTGGIGLAKGEPNLMFGSRTNCLGCHTKQATDKHGGATMRGAVNGCIACHGDRHADTFKKWKQGLELTLADAQEAYDKAVRMVGKAKNMDPEARRKVDDLLRGVQADLQLVKVGNGVHNVMYSMDLLESVTKRCQQAVKMLPKG